MGSQYTATVLDIEDGAKKIKIKCEKWLVDLLDSWCETSMSCS
jgi:hypothetical protein